MKICRRVEFEAFLSLHRFLRGLCAVATAFLCVLVGFPIASKAEDAQAPKGELPLVSAVAEITFLDEAKQRCARANEDEARDATFEAMQEYESVIELAEQRSPRFRHSYESYVVVAAAHLDAARTRILYTDKSLNNLKDKEESQRQIIKHLNAVPTVLGTGMNEAPRDQIKLFNCEGYKLLSYGQFLRGMAEKSPLDLDDASKAYQKVIACDPGSAKQASQMISYISGVKKRMTNSVFSSDNIASIVTQSVKVAVPRVGSVLAAAIGWGYDYYEKKQKAPAPPAYN